MSDANAFLRDPVNETVRREMMVFFRYPADRLRALLPGNLPPMLVAPGTGLVAVGLQRIARCTFSPCTDIGKIYVTAVVQPRLDLGTATPRFGFFVVGMASDQPPFETALQEVDKAVILPTEGLRIHFTEDGVRAEDDDGPILDFARTTPAPAWRRVEVWGQCHTLFEGRHYIQVNHWTGDGFEHSGRPEVGEIHDHRIFGRLFVPGLGQQGWHQMLMRPESGATMVLYKPVEQPHG